MYPIGSYAAPQILSVNPDLKMDSFVMPASDAKEGRTLNSGIDLGFCVTKDCKNKEAAYEVLDFLYADDTCRSTSTHRRLSRAKRETSSYPPC